jgi:hypothetical protein
MGEISPLKSSMGEKDEMPKLIMEQNAPLKEMEEELERLLK